jgi:hypothetical protein
VCVNLTNILGDPVCHLCIHVVAADKLTMRSNASWENILILYSNTKAEG